MLWCNGLLKAGVLDKNIRIPSGQGKLVYRPQDGLDSQANSGSIAQANSRNQFSKLADDGRGKNTVIQYLGIAADEPDRIARHSVRPNILLPLVEANLTEAECRKWCEENDLLSPIYTTAARGGCWFCHNQSVNQLRLLRKNYPDLWQLLLKWDNDSPVTFKPDGRTVHDFDKRFSAEDIGLILPDDPRFKWSAIGVGKEQEQVSIFDEV